MTDEEKWENCRSIGAALQLLNRATKSANRGWRRKFRLCACYMLRQLIPVTLDDRFADALDLAERHFDGESTLAELKAAIRQAQHGYEVHRCDLEEADELAAQSLDYLLYDSPSECVGGAVNSAYGYPRPRDGGHEEALGFVHEMFANPFRPVAFAPGWRTDTAVALAKQMYDSRDFGAMPILADALQDAGCDSDDVLNHCRDPQRVHVRGCWVVDLVLGKA